MNRAIKFRAYPNKEQRILFAKTFGCARFIYNTMLSDKKKHYEETKQMLNNTPAQYKKQYEWLKEVDSLALANAQRNLETAYKNFFKNGSGFPKFKCKKNRQSYTTNCVNNNIVIKDGHIKLPKLGFVKIKQHRIIPSNYILKSVTVTITPSGKYYVSILFDYENQVKEKTIVNAIGLDFSMSELFIASNGFEAHYPKYYRKAQDKLAKEQRKLSKMVHNSKNYQKQRIRVAKVNEKIANQRKDFLHKMSYALANEYDHIFIEDLNMKNMSKALNFGKSVNDNGWGMFTTFLDYKLSQNGGKLVKVNKWFASSQTCSNCGYINKDVKNLSIRDWECTNCHTHHNRDVNAAINILNEGMFMMKS